MSDIRVKSPDGEYGTVPADQAPEAIKQGYVPVDDKEWEESQDQGFYKDAGGGKVGEFLQGRVAEAIGGARGFASGFGIPLDAVVKYGLKGNAAVQGLRAATDIDVSENAADMLRGYQDAHPFESTYGEIGGTVGAAIAGGEKGLVPGGGPVTELGNAGAGAVARLTPSIVLQGAVRGGLEGAALSAIDEVNTQSLEDGDWDPGRVLAAAGIGLGAGLVVGGGAAGVSKISGLAAGLGIKGTSHLAEAFETRAKTVAAGARALDEGEPVVEKSSKIADVMGDARKEASGLKKEARTRVQDVLGKDPQEKARLTKLKQSADTEADQILAEARDKSQELRDKAYMLSKGAKTRAAREEVELDVDMLKSQAEQLEAEAEEKAGKVRGAAQDALDEYLGRGAKPEAKDAATELVGGAKRQADDLVGRAREQAKQLREEQKQALSEARSKAMARQKTIADAEKNLKGGAMFLGGIASGPTGSYFAKELAAEALRSNPAMVARVADAASTWAGAARASRSMSTEIADAVHRYLSSPGHAVARATSLGLSRAFNPDDHDEAADFIQNVTQLESSPDAKAKYIDEQTRALSAAPTLKGAVQARMAQNISLVAHPERLPKGVSPMGPWAYKQKPVYSDAELQDYSDYANTVADPREAIQAMHEHRLTASHIAALHDAHPEVMQDLANAILEEAGRRPLPPDYQKQVQLSMLLGTPMDATLDPQFVGDIQQMYVDDANKRQEGSQGGGSAPKAGSLSKRYASASDRLEEEK